MPVPVRRALALLAVAAWAAAAGCSSRRDAAGEGPGRADELREVAGLLRLYSGEHRRGPARANDLARYAGGFPLGYRALQAGEVVVVWGATMPGEGERGKGDAVVAYEKKAPSEGGLVLFHDGAVKELSAAAFAAAPKAGP
jgi:hypothetical protein